MRMRCPWESRSWRGPHWISSSRSTLEERLHPVGAGEGLCGEGTLASPPPPLPCLLLGDASVPSHHIHHPIDSNKIEKPIPHPAFLVGGRGPRAQLRWA